MLIRPRMAWEFTKVVCWKSCQGRVAEPPLTREARLEAEHQTQHRRASIHKGGYRLETECQRQCQRREEDSLST